MEIFSILALILLSLAGYSGGAVARAGKARDLKPRGIDLVLVALIWAGAILSREIWSLNRWLLIVLWILGASIVGYAAATFRKEGPPLTNPRKEAGETASAPRWKGIWLRWKDFSGRMGGFQSRIILSFFYFLIVSPFALAVKTLSDPLGLKHRFAGSYWQKKQEGDADLEESRRQF